MKSSHNTASGFISTGFRKVSEMRKRATFALFWGYSPIPLLQEKNSKRIINIWQEKEITALDYG